MLTELARQVGLALHNAQLDSALQASLDELRRRERRAARVARPHRRRGRPVAPADRTQPARRRAAAPRRARGEARPGASAARRRSRRPSAPMLEELARRRCRRRCRSCASSRTASTRRCSWTAAWARRCARPRTAPCCRPTCSADVGRYPPEVEAAVYFCCLEALQNAGKHAGEGARDHGHGRGGRRASCASRSPTTAPASTRRRDAVEGHGFVNMADRVGAIGGIARGRVSAAGSGTHGPRAGSRRAGCAIRGRRRGRASLVARRAVPQLADERGAEVLLVDVRDRAARRGVGGEVGLGVRRQQDHAACPGARRGSGGSPRCR